ncbi:MAG: hypothetical protein AB1765_08270 [Candidatus Hydrogenedentota bacterium]
MRVAGAPLDNNICEQALKKVILQRKKTRFFTKQILVHTSVTCL